MGKQNAKTSVLRLRSNKDLGNDLKESSLMDLMFMGVLYIFFAWVRSSCKNKDLRNDEIKRISYNHRTLLYLFIAFNNIPIMVSAKRKIHLLL